MNTALKERISELVDEIRRREAELVELLQGSEAELRYRLEGTRVRFERAVLEAHRKLRRALLPWLARSELRNVLSAPFIYAMIIPIAFLDLTITLYQWVCFPLYGIERVSRRRYLVVDRQHLAYLNAVERLNCAYCGYANGVMAYARAVVLRTERYWCPIKHARRALGQDRQQLDYADYGDAEAYPIKVQELRAQARSRLAPTED